MHQLHVHHLSWNPEFFVTQFLEGLKPEIRAVVLLHRPSDMDTAVDLACLQEEVAETVQREPRRMEFLANNRGGNRPGGAIPVGAGRVLGGTVVSREDRNLPMEHRVVALRAYRKAKGLCHTCGERWSREHKCGPTVQLHVVEELLDLLENSEENQTVTISDEIESEETKVNGEVCQISKEAMLGTETSGTLRLQGLMQHHQIMLLVDSGSTHSFVSAALADKLGKTQRAVPAIKVRIADGGILHCNKEIVDCLWLVQGQSFLTSLKVLPLGSYDVILGMDWLEQHSPMKVDWQAKTLQFNYNQKEICLKGVKANIQNCKTLSATQVQGLVHRSAVRHVVEFCSIELAVEDSDIPAEVSQLLLKFAPIFEEPKGLPPSRAFDHSIPLLPGAKPVNLRPYRYNPVQKDEIERQVAEMLQQGVIQPSASHFSSPVLLVQKKDLTWRFCIDYRHLNAIAVKNRYPLPIIDELLDELAGSSLFTSLDLRAGYHQIRMRPEDEHKTACKTHNGHYEFRVMSFGLTGAPATFQGIMNQILAPLLRKVVLVFIDDILIYSRTLQEHLILLHQVFQLLSEHQLKVKRSTCSFARPSLTYLGHVISASGVATDPKNIKAVQAWTIPVNVKEVRRFLGLAGYYRKFVRSFGIISQPLTDLLKKNVVFVWTSEHQAAFDALKAALTSAPVLALPDFTKVFEIETDASDKGVGAVLMKEGQPLAFLSKSLGPRN